ncbi:MAG: NTP transferase domain-containing protein, partial [Gammaproteobacteria bacterium]
MSLVPDISALVLAGGAGRRFDPSGRRWKLTQALPDGRAVLRASCEALIGQVCEVVVVHQAREAEVRRALDGLPVGRVRCAQAAAGMGATLKCGVFSTRPSTGWLIALGDMPFVAPSTVAAVCEAMRRGALVVRPVFDGRPGHPVGFRTTLREELLAI